MGMGSKIHQTAQTSVMHAVMAAAEDQPWRTNQPYNAMATSGANTSNQRLIDSDQPQL